MKQKSQEYEALHEATE